MNKKEKRFIGKVLHIKSIIDCKGVCTLDNRTEYGIKCKSCWIRSRTKNGNRSRECSGYRLMEVAERIWNDIKKKGGLL